MATGTAVIIAGSSHRNHGGIQPAGMLTLFENSRPVWRFQDLAGDGEVASWVPFGPDSILEDGLLVLAAVGMRDADVGAELDRLCGDVWQRAEVDLSETGSKASVRLRQLVDAAVDQTKLVLTVLTESSVYGQLGVLDRLTGDVELCLPAYWRRSSQWGPGIEAGGALPG